MGGGATRLRTWARRERGFSFAAGWALIDTRKATSTASDKRLNAICTNGLVGITGDKYLGGDRL